MPKLSVSLTKDFRLRSNRKAAHQEWGTCGPWAKRGPHKHLLWPAQAF